MDVQLSPVIKWNQGARRVCEDTDVSYNLGTVADPSYSPNYDPTAGADNLTSYEIDWGDGNSTGVQAYPAGGPPPNGDYGAAAGEWDLAGAATITFTITITLTDDDGNSTTIYEQIEVVDCTAFPFDAWGAIADAPYHATTWSAMTAGLTGDWLDVNDVNIENPGEVWIVTEAGLAWSDDVGLTWHKVDLDDPPNSWEDHPAPTASSVSYKQMVRPLSFPYVAYVLVGYQEGGGDYRAYLLTTSDNFLTSSWVPLGQGGLDPQWIYLDSMIQGVDWFGAATQCDTAVLSDVNQVDILGAPDAAVGGSRVDFPFDDVCGVRIEWGIYDLGEFITLDAAITDDGDNVRIQMGNTAGGTLDRGAGTSCPDANDAGSLSIQTGVIANYPWTWRIKAADLDWAGELYTAARTEATPFRYVRIVTCVDMGSPSPFKHAGDFLQMLADYVGFLPAVVPALERRALGIAVNTAGTYLYLTLLEDGIITLRVYSVAGTTLIPESVENLGAATNAQIDSRTYWAKPYCPPIMGGAYSQHVYVYGCLNPGWNGIEHLVFSGDAGVSFDPIGDEGWYTESWIGDMACDPLKEFPLYVCLNDTSEVAPRLFILDESGGTWVSPDDLPFDSEAMSLHPDYLYELIVGDRAPAGAVIVKYTMDDGVTWFDVSAGITAAQAVRSLKILSER